MNTENSYPWLKPMLIAFGIIGMGINALYLWYAPAGEGQARSIHGVIAWVAYYGICEIATKLAARKQ